MYRLEKRDMVEVTPGKAEEYLSLNDYVTQRKLRPAHVNDLAAKMKNGKFRFGEVALARHPKGTTFLLNGQHVCNAIIQTGLSQMCVVEEFKVDNDIDLSTLFKQFEILPRTISDMVRVEKHALNLDWPDKIASLVVSAAAIDQINHPSLKSNVSVSNANLKWALTKEHRANLLKSYLEEGYFIKKILIDDAKDGDVQHLKRSAVVVMMFRTMRKSYQDAFVFWSRVRDGENLTKDMPEWKIREFLKSHKTISYREEQVYRKATNHEIAYRIAAAWNAFREGRSLKVLKYRHEHPVPNLK
jgi:hypothetical protein